MLEPEIIEEAESVVAQLKALGTEIEPVVLGGRAVVSAAVAFIEKMTQPEPVAVMEKLADDMNEAARYTRGEPDYVRRAIDGFHPRLAAEPTCSLVDAARLSDNLFVGGECVAVQPSIAEAYLKSAASELKQAARRIRVRKEKEADALARSAE